MTPSNNLIKTLLVIAFSLFMNVQAITAQTPKNLVARLGLLNGKAKSLPKPVYPPAAIKSKASGAVTVNVTVNEKGDVISATSDFENPLLKEAAIAAAKQAKFEPYMFQGKARKVTGSLVYNFAGPPKDDLFDFSDLADYIGKGDGSFMSVYSIMDVPDKIEKGKFDDAIKILDPMIAKDPKDTWALGHRAMAYFGKSERLKALADANAALAIMPDNVRALNARALAERSISQFDLATKDFDRAIAISTANIAKRPGSMDDYFMRAETYRLRGDNEKAAADYRKTLELTPGYQFAKEHLDLVMAKPDNAKVFKAHFEEFTRLDALYETAADNVDTIEEALHAENKKKGRPMYAKPADNSGICKALSEQDRLFDKLFSESYDMTRMKEEGELEGHPEAVDFADEAEKMMDGRGGDILVRQLAWGCKK